MGVVLCLTASGRSVGKQAVQVFPLHVDRMHSYFSHKEIVVPLQIVVVWVRGDRQRPALPHDVRQRVARIIRTALSRPASCCQVSSPPLLRVEA